MKKFRLNLPVSMGFYFLLAFLYLAVVAAEWQVVQIVGPQVAAADFKFPAIYRLLLIGGLVCYAFMRFWAVHPAANIRYAAWLMSTPWRAGEPLPLGPLHLVWQDLLLLISVFLIERWQLGLSGLEPVIAFGITYAASATAALFVTKPNFSALIILAGLPAILLLLQHQWWLLLLVGILNLIAAIATRQSLEYFPWKMLEPRPQPEAANWLFTRLGPVKLGPKVPMIWALVCSVFVGWWVFCVMTAVGLLNDHDTLEGFRDAFGMVGGLVAIIRLMIYMPSFSPPISILGRFATGRPIIPGYDKIFVAPILTFLAGLICPYVLLLGMPPALSGAVCSFFILLPALACGPSLYRWRLVGYHQISSSPPAGTNRTGNKSSQKVNVKFS